MPREVIPARRPGQGMLRVVGLSDPSGRYYLSGPPDELVAGLVPAGIARWTGRGASDLGLAGPPSADDLAAVLSGRRPHDGPPLAARAHSRCGFDLTFSAPKSLSVLLGVGAPEVAREVGAAHEAAVDSALAYVAGRAAGVQRSAAGDRSLVGVDGLVAAAFTHGVSRALDPHLHTHVLVANVVHGDDGRWSALDGRGLFAHARAAGSLYDAHLRYLVGERLGLRFERRASGTLEVDGIGPEVLGAFSLRRAEIAEYMHDRSGSTSMDRRRAWASTRDARPNGLVTEDLRAAWRARMADLGVDPDLAPRAEVARTVDERRFAGAIMTVSGGVTRRVAVAAWAESLDQGAPAGDVEHCVDLLTQFRPAVGVAEERHGSRDLVAASHHLRALGARPATPRRLAEWREAASALDRYRQRWPPEDPRWPLGIAGGADQLARLPAGRLAEHLAVKRRIDEARRRLGVQRAATPEGRAMWRGR